MFTSAKNTLITGGSFVNTSNAPSLAVLHKRVAPNAILNVGGRADDVRCHPGTREEIIGRIKKWGNVEDGQTAPMFWLSGPAGAGKSAIVQTIAEQCKQGGVPQANFFFFRTDATRSTAFPLIATLVYQIVSLYPSLRNSIATQLSDDPLALDSTLEDQLTRLIITPLHALQQSSSGYRPLILLIDGLDECDSESKRDQKRILDAFDKVMGEHSCPFRLLVASRDESQIRAAFNQLSSQFSHLFLDDQYSPEVDIRVFVQAQFEHVRKMHPLARTLHVTWPLVKDIDYIVEKSSGQFIYAATVMRFISDSAASPMLSLDRVKGAAKLATKSPFSHLDAIYTYILSQVDDQDTLKDILHAQTAILQFRGIAENTLNPVLIATTMPLKPLLEALNKRYTKESLVVPSCLADLTPIARYDAYCKQLLFYHASFSDYLSDQSRSSDYFVDMAVFSYKILPAVFWKSNRNLRQAPADTWVQFGLSGITQLQKLPPHLLNIAAKTSFQRMAYAAPQKCDIFRIIYNLCTCDDDIKYFRRIFKDWIGSRNIRRFKFDDIEDIPFSHGEMAAALRPETDFDHHEMSRWLRDLLMRAYENYKFTNARAYEHLLKTWIPWAITNGIPCDVLEKVPLAQPYIQSGTKKKWMPQIFTFRFGGSRK